MFTKMKKNMAKKALITIWLLVTTLYTIYGVYSYFKFSVYQAGANAAYNYMINQVVNSKCQPVKLHDSVSQFVVDVACLQQTQGEQADTPVAQ